jgi:hypothetical protein
MLKKVLIGTGTAAVLGSLIFGRDVMSYGRTAWTATREAVKREVPLDFQIERARTSVAQLTPAIQHTLKVIAEQQVDIEHLTRDIAGRSTYRYANASYTADEVRRDVKTRFDRFKAAESFLERDRRIQKSREQALYAHEKQLDQMLSQKKDLEAQVEQLEARLQTIRAEETVSAPQIDESELANVKRLIAEVNKQLDVQEKLLDANGKFVGLIPVEVKPTVDISSVTAEIDDYFKPATDKKATDAPNPVSAVAKAEVSK